MNVFEYFEVEKRRNGILLKVIEFGGILFIVYVVK